MKSTQLWEENGLRTFLLVMDEGDEAFEQITGFAESRGITAASLTAIGAARHAVLGYFDREAREYRFVDFDEQMEIASCIGDIADNQGDPALHAHIVLGREDFTALAGHLKELRVFPTMEVVLTETPAHLRKRVDPRTGLALISTDDSTEP
ncbi:MULTISPECIES: PPC domain-containing DNA-binding protein [unclassified Nocardiopsis]|uniref:PPC domain-containing DNA-binding protein n=1 Tax=unclassified Nocardiopsis TaxID=2649073 RepID=UPI00135BFF1F|nr:MULTISPECIES: PPC domain-containing DNA-binding protein [unclassified Nocardiopsis]